MKLPLPFKLNNEAPRRGSHLDVADEPVPYILHTTASQSRDATGLMHSPWDLRVRGMVKRQCQPILSAIINYASLRPYEGVP